MTPAWETEAEASDSARRSSNGLISRDQIKAKLDEISGRVEPAADQAKGIGVGIGILAVSGLVAAVYLIGRRRGRKSEAIVEIRRL